MLLKHRPFYSYCRCPASVYICKATNRVLSRDSLPSALASGTVVFLCFPTISFGALEQSTGLAQNDRM